MESGFILELAAIIIIATAGGFLFRKLKQPVLLAFIFTGILLGSAFFNVIESEALLEIFSSLGIAFLLFLVGISLDPRIFKEIGKASTVTGMGQIIFTTIVGLGIALFFGFSLIESIYIAVALTFSSTIIIVKLLSDKKEINSLYGKISIGFLIVQDFVAIIALILIASLSFSGDFTENIFRFGVNLVLLLSVFIVSTKFLAEKVFNALSKSQELLFIGAIAWCFAFTAMAVFLGFSMEIGAFIAGVSIASLQYSKEIAGKLKPLRDFFIVLFFVVLGTRLVFTAMGLNFFYALIFSFFVLIGNPIIVFLLMALMGYKGRTSFFSSLTVAQISEFSLILIFLGARVGHISNEIVSIVTMVTVITISVSTYFIIYSNQLYNLLEKKLPVLKTKRFFEDSLKTAENKQYPLICIGFGETGQSILKNWPKKEEVLVVDFDPAAVKKASEKFPSLYGDAADLETIEHIIDSKPKIIVSTVMDVETNLALAEKLSKAKNDTKLIVLAHTPADAKKLDKAGVDFVLVPILLSAKRIRTILQDIQQNRSFELKFLKDLEFSYD